MEQRKKCSQEFKLDLFPRQGIGWLMQLQLTRDLVTQIVSMAVWQRSSPEPVILHSDRGTQDSAEECQAFLYPRSSTKDIWREVSSEVFLNLSVQPGEDYNQPLGFP